MNGVIFNFEYFCFFWLKWVFYGVDFVDLRDGFFFEMEVEGEIGGFYVSFVVFGIGVLDFVVWEGSVVMSGVRDFLFVWVFKSCL